jgi:hypothetical protein
MQKFKLNILEKYTTRNTTTKKLKNILKNIFYIFALFLSSIFLGVFFLELLTRI